MSTFDIFTEGFKSLLEASKEVPTENIAAIGLIVVGVCAIVNKGVSTGIAENSIDVVKNLFDKNL